MVEIKIISGQKALETGLVEQILEFDKRNMHEILEQAGIPFPEEKRRTSFETNPTFIIAFNNDVIAGYLEYCCNWENRNEIYISSLQIDHVYRGGTLLLKLLNSTRESLIKEEFTKIVSGVQKNNSRAIRLYQKL